MNDLPRIHRDVSGKSVSAPRAGSSKKLAVYLMAAFVAAVMITWLGFLGWAVYALFFWLKEFVWVASA